MLEPSTVWLTPDCIVLDTPLIVTDHKPCIVQEILNLLLGLKSRARQFLPICMASLVPEVEHIIHHHAIIIHPVDKSVIFLWKFLFTIVPPKNGFFILIHAGIKTPCAVFDEIMQTQVQPRKITPGITAIGTGSHADIRDRMEG